MSRNKVSRSDILLAIIAAANGRELTRVHLQKVAFLVSEEFKGSLPADFYSFDKHNYGPFCIDIYNDTDMLHYWGWIKIQPGADKRQDRYTIAESVDLDAMPIDERLLQYIRETVAWVADMSFGEIVRAIYWLYPEYREKSIFKYSEAEAEAESFARSIKQLRQGKTYNARQRLEELTTRYSDEGCRVA